MDTTKNCRLQSWTLYKSADCRWISITILCVSFTNSATAGRLEQVQLCNRLIDQSADNITGLKCAKECLRRKSFIRPHKAAAGRRLAPALHSKAGHRICSRSHEECVLTWLACCDRPQDYSFLVTMGANGVLGLFVDIKALTTNAHFKVDWPTWGINKK